MKVSLTLRLGASSLGEKRNHLRDVEGLLVDTLVHLGQAGGAVALGGDHVVVVHTGIFPALKQCLYLVFIECI